MWNGKIKAVQKINTSLQSEQAREHLEAEETSAFPEATDPQKTKCMQSGTKWLPLFKAYICISALILSLQVWYSEGVH